MIVSKLQRHRASWLGCGALVLAVAACSHDKPAPQSAANLSPAATSEPAPSEQVGDAGTAIRLSQEIERACRFTPEGDVPLFDVNDSTLKPRGRDILADVANCLKEGPLSGRTVTIIGRTDARGTPEHNQDLGASRADATRNYLMQLGVPERKMLVISRGEEAATGNDEASMALDRRVDLVLGDATERTNISQYPPANQTGLKPGNHASTYADQVEGGPQSGKVTGTSGPGTDSVPGK